MSAFYVGQRVRVVRRGAKDNRPTMPKHKTLRIGAIATVVGTLSRPNGGFAPELGDTSILIDGYPYGPGMVMAFQLEPLVSDAGREVVSWSECLWQPEGIAA